MGNSRAEFDEKSMHCAFVKILEQKESIFPNGNQGNECNSGVTSIDMTVLVINLKETMILI